MIGINTTNQKLYNTTLYVDGNVSNTASIEYVGFDGQVTSGQSRTDRIIEPGGDFSTSVTVSGATDRIGKQTVTFYADGQSCNTNLNPPDCVFLGAGKIDFTIEVVDAISCSLGMYIKFQDITSNGPETKFVSLSLREPGTDKEVWKHDSVPATTNTFPLINTNKDLYRIGIGNMACGTYDIVVGSSGYQEKKYPNILVDSNSNNDPETYIFNGHLVPSVSIMPGDGNNDGMVDLTDLSVLFSDFNKTSDFRKGIDLNKDGKINSFDFSLMRNLLVEKGIIKD